MCRGPAASHPAHQTGEGFLKTCHADRSAAPRHPKTVMMSNILRLLRIRRPLSVFSVLAVLTPAILSVTVLP
jgi:hypothetical protein